MTRAMCERLAQELAADFPLPPEDWDAILTLAERLDASIQTLNELPLDAAEPPAVFTVGPE